mmetsp:Transcript_29876/g.85568  ORF Transcript_29876/g.85568 Transcript_29876/m.85568 type:complete len:226 (+) Transcript_29876:359-1036(+)
MYSWSATEYLSCVRPSRRFGITSMCTGAAGLMSLKTRQRLSSYTTSLGMSLLMILSKMVRSAVSLRPAWRMLSQRPFASHFCNASCISPRTRVAAGTVPPVMCAHQRTSLGPNASSSFHSQPGCMYRGSMSRMNTMVGKSAASEWAISLPVRNGPSSEARLSMTLTWRLSSARASHRLWNAPNGGVALYMQACRATKYTSCTRAMRLSKALASGVAGTNEGATSE